MKPEDFRLEDDPEQVAMRKVKKSLDNARTTCMGFLGKAHALYGRAKRGDPSPTLVGKAIAYLSCFQEIAPEVGINKGAYEKIVTMLAERLGDLVIKIDQDSRKTIVEHRRDPAGVALEQRTIELREKEVAIRIEDKRREAKPAEEPLKVEAQPMEETVVKEVADWLVHSQLGYDRAEAQRRARLAYTPGLKVEELVSKACRIA